MKLKIGELKIGDYVKVKNGIKAPDFEYQLMDGWQGEVVGIEKEYGLVEIKWDSETLLNTAEKYLKDLIKEGYDYEIMTLDILDLEQSNRRDNSEQRKEVKAILDAKSHWVELFDDEEKSIKYGKLFQGIKLNNYDQLYQKWKEYLSENLVFPIETKVVESDRGRIRNGTKIKLLDIEDYEDLYGIFGVGKCDRKAVTFPICNLEAIDKKSKNHGLLKDYAIWFANR